MLVYLGWDAIALYVMADMLVMSATFFLSVMLFEMFNYGIKTWVHASLVVRQRPADCCQICVGMFACACCWSGAFSPGPMSLPNGMGLEVCGCRIAAGCAHIDQCGSIPGVWGLQQGLMLAGYNLATMRSGNLTMG